VFACNQIPINHIRTRIQEKYQRASIGQMSSELCIPWSQNQSLEDVHGNGLTQFQDILIHLHKVSFIGYAYIVRKSRSLFQLSCIGEVDQKWEQRVSKVLRGLRKTT
jgi:hypothetical protein